MRRLCHGFYSCNREASVLKRTAGSNVAGRFHSWYFAAIRPAIPRLSIQAYKGLAAIRDTDQVFRVATAISGGARARYNDSTRRGKRNFCQGWPSGPRAGDYAKYLKTIATVRHFVVHSDPEPSRHTFDAVVDKRGLRETCLPHFEAAIREGGACLFRHVRLQQRECTTTNTPHSTAGRQTLQDCTRLPRVRKRRGHPARIVAAARRQRPQAHRRDKTSRCRRYDSRLAGGDRLTLDLPAVQEELLEKVPPSANQRCWSS